MIARVLVIDDDEHIRRALASSLSRAGFEVMTADDGVAAYAMAESVLFELILIDYHLKTSTGIEVVRHFKHRYGADVYCAVLSGEDDDETRDACLAAGADDVMSKPMSPSELRRRLTVAAQALHGSTTAVG